MTDRKTAMSWLEGLTFDDWRMYHSDTEVQNIAKCALELLKEQEPKTGHWIDSAGDDKCSVCRATYSVLYPDYHHTHYCPNRGAKMIIQAVEYSDESNEG